MRRSLSLGHTFAPDKRIKHPKHSARFQGTGRHLRFLLFLAACTIFAGSPVSPDPVTLKQPDGTTFQAQPKGGWYVTWMETEAGHSIVREGDTWYYAKLEDGRLKPTNMKVGDALKLDLPKHLRPTVDKSKFQDFEPRRLSPDRKSATVQPLLVIAVSFSDTPWTYEPFSFKDWIFGDGDSVNAYYRETSYGRFQITPALETQDAADGFVSVTLDTPHPNFGNDYSMGRTELVQAAFEAADPFIDYSVYDTNGDGRIRPYELGVLLIIAGYENASGGESAPTPRVWAHASGIGSVELDGVDVSSYCMMGERHGANQATIGVICHELGHHFLGLPDLYDRDGSSAGIGRWGLMGGGTWNRVTGPGGSRPCHFSAWSKLHTGFAEAEDVAEPFDPRTHTFQSFSASPDIKRIWLDRYRSGEHFLITFRTRDGYDSGLPGHGMAIWHVDPARFLERNDDEQNKLLDLEEADGSRNLDFDANSGDGGDLFPGFTSNLLFSEDTNPNSLNAADEPTGVSVAIKNEGLSELTAVLQPGTLEPGAAIRYDEFGISRTNIGYNDPVVWTALQLTNTTELNQFQGFALYMPADAVIDFYIYDAINEGQLGNRLHEQIGFTAVTGQNQFLLENPQSFPPGESRVMVLRIEADSYNYPAAYDSFGPISERSWLDRDGEGTFFQLSGWGDLNQIALMGLDTLNPTHRLVLPFTEESAEWETTLALVNPNDQAARLVLTGFTNSGAEIESHEHNLASNGRLVGRVRDLFNTTPAMVIATSEQPIVGQMEVVDPQKHQSFAVPATSKPHARLNVPHVAESDLFWTRGRVVNAGTITPQLSFQTADGAAWPTGLNAPYTSRSIDFKTDFYGSYSLPAGTGWGVFQNNENLALFAGVELFGQSPNFSTAAGLELTGNANTTLIMPHIPADKQVWWAGLVLVNINQVSSQVRGIVYDQNGMVLAENGFTLGPNEKRSALYESYFPDAEAGEWVMFLSEQPLIGYQLFGTRDFNGDLAGLEAPTSGVTEQILPWVQANTNGRWTGLSFVNPGETNATATLTLFDNDGNQMAQSERINIPAKVKRVSLVENYLSPLSEGWIKVESSQPIIAFELYGANGFDMISGLNALRK